MTTSKTPKTEEKKPKEKATKGKSDKRKSKAAQEDEEMADAPEPEPEEKPLDPAEARKAREKEGEDSEHHCSTPLIVSSSIPPPQTAKRLPFPGSSAPGRGNGVDGDIYQ